jgi:hypothetical protein
MNEIAKVLGADTKGGQNAVIERIIETLIGRDAILLQVIESFIETAKGSTRTRW